MRECRSIGSVVVSDVGLHLQVNAYPLNVRSTMEIRGSHLGDFFLVFPFL